MARALSTLVLGASFGPIMACKLLHAGHSVDLICEAANAEMLEADGVRVRLPAHREHESLEVDSSLLPGELRMTAPSGIDPSSYDLVVLAMEEPQYRLPGVRELLVDIGTSRVPCISVMRMPPPPFLRRIPGLDTDMLSSAYTDFSAWQTFAKQRVTQCIAQWSAAWAYPRRPNEIHALLPVDLRVAPFESTEDTAILHRIASRNEHLFPLKLTVSDSVHAPLATWPTILAGSYRCITERGIRCAREAVLADIATSQSVYEFVAEVCLRMGARSQDLACFDEFAASAEAMARPDSPARELQDGARFIERTDLLVQMTAQQHGLRHDEIDRIVALVDRRLDENRRATTH